MKHGSVSSGSLLEAPHHDGSPAYCPDPPKEHGDSFTVLLRTSADDPVTPRGRPPGARRRAVLRPGARRPAHAVRHLVAGGSGRPQHRVQLPVPPRRRLDRLPLAQRRRAGRGRCARRRGLPGRPGLRGPGLARRRDRLPDAPRPLRPQRPGDRAVARLGRPRRLGRRPEARRAPRGAAVLRRRPLRRGRAPGPHRRARGQHPLPDAGLPRRLEPPLQRLELRPRRSRSSAGTPPTGSSSTPPTPGGCGSSAT